MSNNKIDARAFSLPEINYRGAKKVPVVVMLDQGGAAAGNGDADNDLAPVGAGGQDHAIGADGDAAFAGGADDWKANMHAAKEPKGSDDKRYPVRVYHLIDVSTSMRGPSGITGRDGRPLSKIDLLKQEVKQMNNKLPPGTDHVLIPFSYNAGAIHISENELDVINEISELELSGGTRFSVALEQADDLMTKYRNSSDSHEKDTRNIVHLITDGDDRSQSKEARKNLLKKLLGQDASLLVTGVGTGYKQAEIDQVLKEANSGVVSHIPQIAKQGKKVEDLFGKAFPKFVSETASADNYLRLKFNKWFDKVVALTPKARNIEMLEDSDTDVNLGYQNKAFAIGLIDPNKFEHAEIELVPKNKASDDEVLYSKAINIEDFQSQVGLDIKDRNFIELAPYKFHLKELIRERNPQKIFDFIEANQNLPVPIKRLLQQIKQKIEAQKEAANDHGEKSAEFDVADSRLRSAESVIDIIDVDLEGADFTAMNQPVPGDLDTHAVDNAMVNTMHGDIKSFDHAGKLQEALDLGDASSFGMDSSHSSIGDSVNMQIPLPKGIKNFSVLSFSGANDEARKFLQNNPASGIALDEGSKIKLGRAHDCDIKLKAENVSRGHALLERHEGDIIIHDLKSRNGVYVNGVQISGNQKVSNGDQISIGDYEFSLKIT